METEPGRSQLKFYREEISKMHAFSRIYSGLSIEGEYLLMWIIQMIFYPKMFPHTFFIYNYGDSIRLFRRNRSLG